MASYVKQITDAIEDRLITIIPTFVKNPNTWSSPTGSTKNKNLFKVMPGEAASTDGTNRTITIRQKFKIELSIIYKADNDATLQGEIETLYSSLELVTSEAMQRRFAINRIMNVLDVELSEPEIDHINHTVTIGASYSVLYRME